MWSTFFTPDEEGRVVGGGISQGGVASQGGPASLLGLTAARGHKRRRAGSASGHAPLSEALEGKIKLTFFVAIVGVVLTILGVGTEFWAELSPPKRFYNNETCLTAHYGLWKGCIRTLWLVDVHPDRHSCGPAELPGESNCTYFKFFTTGENTVMFQKTMKKELNVAAAMLAVFSLFLMLMGSACVTVALSKQILFLLKPAAFCFSLAGVAVLASLLVFHRSVAALLASDPSVPLQHRLSWSAGCLGCAGAALLAGGFLFLLLALPHHAWQRCGCGSRRGGTAATGVQGVALHR